jgi:gluconokinase
MIFFLFGLLGAGKNFVGKIFAEEFGFSFYDADQDLTPAMKDAIANHRQFSARMRDEYFEVVIRRIAELKEDHQKLVIAQALFKNRNQRQIWSHFPEIKFVWVQADEGLLATRLSKRQDHRADQAYGEMVNKLFEIPNIPHDILVNNKGKEEIIEQIASLLDKQERWS